MKKLYAIIIFSITAAMGMLLLGGLLLLPENIVDVNSIPFQKFLQAVQSGLIFALPAVITVIIFAKNPCNFLRLKQFNQRNFWLTTAFIFTAIPAIGYINLLNQKMRLPAFLSGIEQKMRAMEDVAAQLTEQFLTVNSIGGLLVNLLVIALIAAVCEEVLFRGFLQKVFEKEFKNAHLAIWLSAFIFSAIHLQFYGFFPRMLLGAAFGYIVFWTGSLWLPILAHFINNAIGVITFYVAQQRGLNPNIDDIPLSNSWLFAAACGLASLLILNKIYLSKSKYSYDL
ncbi:MAG: CPBP family intramembrane metalloprotease [Prevotellaceae bacterium]|jgi:membrane protease YdiL (CAAX protease family)|nr:CPBP family intramembrane metalloprotease [Prevotellaceae bacterium]